jgi:hypothetical protein
LHPLPAPDLQLLLLLLQEEEVPTGMLSADKTCTAFWSLAVVLVFRPTGFDSFQRPSCIKKRMLRTTRSTACAREACGPVAWLVINLSCGFL